MFKTTCNMQNNRISVFVGTGNRNFKMVTKIIESGNRVIIKRNIFWFDSEKNVNKSKVEIQVYDCVNVNDEKEDYKQRMCDLIMNFEKIS